ncbi:MAG: hypothetical protein VX728_03190, partial [Actinomycetota bacterium]|nr:hypothetical protein [Actinomycetota bacterium]
MADVSFESGELRRQRNGYVFDVIDLIGFPELELLGPMRLQAMFREKVWIAGRNNCITDKSAGFSVIGMEAIALPWVMGEHHIGL